MNLCHRVRSSIFIMKEQFCVHPNKAKLVQIRRRILFRPNNSQMNPLLVFSSSSLSRKRDRLQSSSSSRYHSGVIKVCMYAPKMLVCPNTNIESIFSQTRKSSSNKTHIRHYADQIDCFFHCHCHCQFIINAAVHFAGIQMEKFATFSGLVGLLL